MNSGSNGIVNVFPITKKVFGFSANWFDTYAPLLIRPAYLLMVLLLVIYIGIMVLKRFENFDVEKKLWNLPVIITVIATWPVLILGLKDFIDYFNTFLIRDIFQIPWEGFGYPDMGSITNIFGWSADAIARLLPNLTYWIIYAFYMVFFFFFAVLGPFVLAKGILFDEIEAFLELLKELTLLFLWQTTLAILVAVIMPSIVSGKPFPSDSEDNIYFLSLILGIIILFVPSITRKFGDHIGSSLFPPALRWGTTIVGVSAMSKGLSATGLPVSPHNWSAWTHRALAADEVRKRSKDRRQFLDLKEKNYNLEHEFEEYQHEEADYESKERNDYLISLSKQAKLSFENNRKPNNDDQDEDQ